MLTDFGDGASSTEMILLVVINFFVNGVMYGMLTASLASLLVSMTASSQRYNEQMDGIREWMRSKRISTRLKSDISA